MRPKVEIDGKGFYTVKEFAILTYRTEQSIRRLCAIGNRLRRLKSLKVGTTILIPAHELEEFPFTASGRSDVVYHYEMDEEGVTKVVEAVEA
jgi:hypothetical protein